MNNLAMTAYQAYTNPLDEMDAYKLPDLEIWEAPDGAWYWWECSPGCLPSSEENGPFDSLEEALADARVWAG